MWKTHNFANPIYILTIFSTLISISFSALAGEDAPQTFSLSGTLYQSGTNIPLQDPNTKLLIQILNPDKTCLLYEELQTINVKSNGFFNVQVGSSTNSSKRTVNDPKLSMAVIFQNNGMIFGNNTPGANCIGGIYVPSPGDTRYVRITVTPSSTNVPDRLVPDLTMNSTPSALVAQSVQGLERNKILQIKETNATYIPQLRLAKYIS